MKKRLLYVMLALTAMALYACGGGGSDADDLGTGDVGSVTVVSSTSAGDYTPSITPTVDADKNIQFTVGGLDIDEDGTIETPAISTVSAASVKAMITKAIAIAKGTITCEKRELATTDDRFDIGVSLDVTGSMGYAAGILASKIADFATALAAADVDAQFAGVTLGDAFATKKETGSAFTAAATTLGITDNSVGTLLTSDTLPAFQDEAAYERADTGPALLIASGMTDFFSLVEEVYTSGGGGGDGPENYLGTVQYVADGITWRSDSTRIIVSISDNCSHTDETYEAAGITTPWIPPSGATLAANLAGNFVVHVIGADYSAYEEYVTGDHDDYCDYLGNYYDPRGLATITGGTFTDIGNCAGDYTPSITPTVDADKNIQFTVGGSVDTCNVDLTALPITDAITSRAVYYCDGSKGTYDAASGTYTITYTITTTVTGSTSGEAKTATTTLVVTVVFI